MDKVRCEWANQNKHYKEHHDNFWGNICKDEKTLFELLILESQATGLSFSILLAKQEGYRKHFDFNNIESISKLSEQEIIEISKSNDVIKDVRKLSSIVSNANAYLKLIKDHKSLYDYLWSKVNFKQQRNNHPYLKGEGCFLDLAKEVKKHTNKVVCGVGKLQTPEFINNVLEKSPIKTIKL